MDVFNRYAPFIQDTIYERGWQSLRGVQVAAGDFRHRPERAAQRLDRIR